MVGLITITPTTHTDTYNYILKLYIIHISGGYCLHCLFFIHFWGNYLDVIMIDVTQERDQGSSQVLWLEPGFTILIHLRFYHLVVSIGDFVICYLLKINLRVSLRETQNENSLA